MNFFRYKKINDVENSWYSNKQLVKASTTIVLLVLLYGLIITLINAHFELKSFNIYSVCLEGENAKKNTMRFNSLTVVLPVVIMVASTSFMDVSCYFWLKKRDRNSQRGGYLENNIPLRATAISTSLHILFLVGFAVLGKQKLQPLEKYLIVIVLIRIANILRNPLTAVFTFKINDETRQKDATKEREFKRQAEIQSAFRTRKEQVELEGIKNIFKQISKSGLFQSFFTERRTDTELATIHPIST